jgi:EF-P beta-lysylation protein EpmB
MKPDMIPATALPTQPADWKRAWREAITDSNELLALLGLDASRVRLAPTPDGVFGLRVPRGYVARMRRGDPHDPLLRQVLPLSDEHARVPGFALDAVGDLSARVGPGVLHKYQGRALVVTTGSCAIHCRYCFRRHFPYDRELAAAERWASVKQYVALHPELDELILSGGDPWALATNKLADLTQALLAHPGLRRLRIHTRLPVVLPERVDDALLSWIEALPWSVVVVIHANHAQELDDTVAAALRRLRARGVTLLNQAVLLRGVNDDTATLRALSLRLFELGVLPYYLHQLDRVQGTAHFEVTDERARELIAALSAGLPGYLVPKLVREIAGAPAKTPLA